MNLLLLIAEQSQVRRKQVRLIYCIKMKAAHNVLTATSEYKLSRVASSSSYFTLLSGLSIFSSFLVRLLNQVPYSKFRWYILYKLGEHSFFDLFKKSPDLGWRDGSAAPTWQITPVCNSCSRGSNTLIVQEKHQ